MEVKLSKEVVEFAKLKKDVLKKNDKIAQFKLAKIYSSWKTDEYKVKAYELYKKSAANGLTDAMYALGKCYEFGIGVKKDITSAICWYMQTDDNILGDVWEKPSIEADAEETHLHEYFNNPSYQKIIDAMIDEREREENLKTFDDYLEAAQNGDEKAQYAVGNIYSVGNLEVDKDEEKAVYWWEQSAENGNDDAMKRLGEYYKKSRQKEKAVIWYRKYAKSRLVWRDKYLYGYSLQEY